MSPDKRRRSPGIDLIPAAAFAALLTEAARFKRDRQLAPRLNLVPRQNSSGGTNRLYRITDRATHQKGGTIRRFHSSLFYGCKTSINSTAQG